MFTITFSIVYFHYLTYNYRNEMFGSSLFGFEGCLNEKVCAMLLHHLLIILLVSFPVAPALKLLKNNN